MSSTEFRLGQVTALAQLSDKLGDLGTRSDVDAKALPGLLLAMQVVHQEVLRIQREVQK